MERKNNPITTSCCSVQSQTGCGCRPAIHTQHPYWVTDVIKTKIGIIERVDTEWSSRVYWEHFKARMGSFRMKYILLPGLYAVGTPDEQSDVYVSANYMMSFNHLRCALKGLNAWILVIDTDGINVWCAAGKGTFGTEELINRIEKTGLASLVTHRRLIVPQLGAPGVNAAEVKKATGFHVAFGPVRANDIARYVANGYTANDHMRKIQFPIMERLALTPLEIIPIMKKFFIALVIIFLIFGLDSSGINFKKGFTEGYPFFIALFIALLTGSALTPVLLPYIPGRAFAFKGWLAGIAAIGCYSWFALNNQLINDTLFYVMLIFFPLLSSFLALLFTGSATHTSMSGVRKELKFVLPVYLIGSAAATVLLIINKISEWGRI